MEEEIGNACANEIIYEVNKEAERIIKLAQQELVSESTMRYKRRSGRIVKRQNYRDTNIDNMQMAQVKRMVINDNPGVPVKKLNK